MATTKFDFSGSNDFDWVSYLKYRPQYPEALYQHIFRHHAVHSSSWDTAYDMGSGIGVAAAALASRFQKVLASDLNPKYVERAGEFLSANHDPAKFELFVSRAEDTSYDALKKNSVDLVTIAEAIFYTQAVDCVAAAARVLRPKGTFAAWMYDIFPKILGEEPAASILQNKLNSVIDESVKFIVHKMGSGGPPVKLWNDLAYIPFGSAVWQDVTRIHWAKKRDFGPFVTNLLEENVLENCAKPWESINIRNEDLLVVEDVDFEWLERYIDTLYPGVSIREICPNELENLGGAIGDTGDKIRLSFPTSLVIATKR